MLNSFLKVFIKNKNILKIMIQVTISTPSENIYSGEAKKITIDLKITPVTIIFHQQLAEVLMVNLLNNAIRYNIENAETYNTQKWYNYLLLISGILIPPVSIFLIFGFIRSWKKQLLLFLPAFIFFTDPTV